MLDKAKLKSWIKNHYLAIIFFFVAGLLSLSQQLLAINALGGSYNGVPLFNGANVDVYLTRMREIAEDGHISVSAPYLFEYKNNKLTILPTGEFLYTLTGRVFGLSVTDTMLLNQFLFPALLFVLAYVLAWKMTDGIISFVRRVNAVAVGLLVVFGYDFTNIKFTLSVLAGKLSYMHSLLWNRPVNPSVGIVLIFLLLVILWKMVEEKRRYLFLPAGLIIALSVGYYFTWALSLSIVGVLFLIFLLKKEYATALNLFLAIFFSFLITSPYWYVLSQTLVGGDGGNIGLFGAYFTRQPVINKVLLAGMAVFLPCLIIAYLKQKKINQKISIWWWFCLAFLGGGFLAFNAQIIIGIDIAHPHFVQFTIPLTFVALMILFYNFFRPRFPAVWWVMIALVISSSLLFGVNTARSYAFALGHSLELQKNNEMFKWVNANTQKDCVIFAAEEGDRLDGLIPALTHCNVYYIPLGNTAEATPERNYHNFLAYLRVNNVEPSEVENYLKNRYTLLSLNFFTNWEQLFSSGYSQWMDEPVRRVVVDYAEFVKQDFSVELRKFKIDYLLSANELSVSLLKSLPSVKLLHKAGGLYLYQF